MTQGPLLVAPGPRYAVQLSAEQRKELTPTCCWFDDCGQPTVGIRHDGKDGLYYSVCEDHIRMGGTVVLGREAVLELLGEVPR